jgi:hypothetical protein
VRRDQLAGDCVERLVHQRRLVVQRFVQGLESRGAGGEPLAVAGELEARVDAFAPGVGEVVDVEAGEVARLLGRAERAEGRGQRLVAALLALSGRWAEVREARAFRQEAAPDDAEREAGGAARRGAAPARSRSTSPIRPTSGAEYRRRNSSMEASACASSSPSAGACRRRKPIRYAVAGYGVLSWIIGGVTSRQRIRMKKGTDLFSGFVFRTAQTSRSRKIDPSPF